MDDYEVVYLPQFKKEFSNFPTVQQDKILDFTDVYEEFGLSDFSKYEGKITPSWSGLEDCDSNFTYAKDNDLWHYHIGIPEYKQVHSKYSTSDVVLHFQWKNRGNEIALVDIYNHYKFDGSFYLPPESYLEAKAS